MGNTKEYMLSNNTDLPIQGAWINIYIATNAGTSLVDFSGSILKAGGATETSCGVWNSAVQNDQGTVVDSAGILGLRDSDCSIPNQVACSVPAQVP